ncbi:MAG: ATP-binding cassette domain-containing protein [Merdibacter sp.]
MQGETFGLVGESGCGKSTTGRAIVKIYNPTAGKIYYKGEDITQHQRQGAERIPPECADDLPGSICSLNPRMTVGEIIRNRWISTISTTERRTREPGA